MFRTLYARLALVLVAVLVLVGLVYTMVSFSAARKFYEAANQTLHRDLAQVLVRDRNLVEEGRLNEDAVKRTFHEYMTINPSIEIYLLDLDGRIISFSADPGTVKRRQVSLEPIRQFLAAGDDGPWLGDDPRSHDRRKAFSVTPVPSAERPEGYLYVVLRGQRYDDIDQVLEESYFLGLSGAAVAGSLLFGLLAGLVLFRLLTRRLHRLARLMDAFRAADFSRPERFHPPGTGIAEGDEVDRLGATFDQMAERMVAQIDALERQDSLRRDLVAQVSHDLRTPLAALHGYLETLEMKGASLAPEERADHLRIALRHSDRLRRLVSDLFELATLDAREREPRLEPFSVAELVQDVVQKYQDRADRAGVRLTMRPAPDPVRAVADIELVERVLDNLIDNAIDHTPGGGCVTVGVSGRGDRVATTVTDTGSGIPPEERERIFDRFHQGRTAGRGGGHAGLGLAIAKRIIDLHGESVSVSGEPGAGACFEFTLPAEPDARDRVVQSGAIRAAR